MWSYNLLIRITALLKFPPHDLRLLVSPHPKQAYLILFHNITQFVGPVAQSV